MNFINTIDEFERLLAAEVGKKKKSSECSEVLKILQNELTMSRSMENHLRCQLSEAQSRIILLQRDVNELIGIKSKVANQDDIIRMQLSAVKNLKKEIEDMRNNLGEKLSKAIKDRELDAKVTEMEQKIKELEGTNHLLRMEHQMELRNRELRIKELEDEIAQHCAQAVDTAEMVQLQNSYKIRVMELEERNKNLEANLNHLKAGLGLQTGTSPAAQSYRNMWDGKVNVTWADAARKVAAQASATPNTNISRPILQLNEVSSNESTHQEQNIPPETHKSDSNNVNFAMQDVTNKPTFQFKPKFKMPRSSPVSFPILKPPMFGSRSQTLEVQAVRDESKPKKKRLYSSNSNHFID